MKWIFCTQLLNNELSLSSCFLLYFPFALMFIRLSRVYALFTWFSSWLFVLLKQAVAFGADFPNSNGFLFTYDVVTKFFGQFFVSWEFEVGFFLMTWWNLTTLRLIKKSSRSFQKMHICSSETMCCNWFKGLFWPCGRGFHQMALKVFICNWCKNVCKTTMLFSCILPYLVLFSFSFNL